MHVQVFDTTHPVYGVKAVTAIPLVEDRAKLAVSKLASRNAVLARPSLLPRTATRSRADSNSDLEGLPQRHPRVPSPRMIHFPDDATRPRSSSLYGAQHTDSDDEAALSSGASSPTSDDATNMAAVARALATKLSFWNRFPKPTGDSGGEREPLATSEYQDTLASMEEPEEVLDSILAPTPATSEERHSQLEEKIVKECIREYTKGGMYFAYTFGKRSAPADEPQVQQLRAMFHRHHKISAAETGPFRTLSEAT